MSASIFCKNFFFFESRIIAQADPRFRRPKKNSCPYNNRCGINPLAPTPTPRSVSWPFLPSRLCPGLRCLWGWHTEKVIKPHYFCGGHPDLVVPHFRSLFWYRTKFSRKLKFRLCRPNGFVILQLCRSSTFGEFQDGPPFNNQVHIYIPSFVHEVCAKSFSLLKSRLFWPEFTCRKRSLGKAYFFIY